MPVPKRKRSKSRRDKRFANKAVKIKSITACKQCSAPLVPHVACAGCGFYKGEKVISTKVDRGQKRVEVMQAKKQKVAEKKTAETK